MLSFGIEYERAFSIAFASAMFVPGSAPPSLAATRIERESLVNSLPRLASAAPFLCLIVDHLLCPDTLLLPDELQKPFVHPRVVRQLRVERRDEDSALAREHRVPVDLGENSDARTGLGDPRRADEHGGEGLRLPRDLDGRLEACDLASEGVALDGQVDQPEPLPVEHDHSGAGAEDRCVESADGLVEPVEPHEAHHRGRLTARDDQAVEALELFGQAHLDRLDTEAAEHRDVL